MKISPKRATRRLVFVVGTRAQLIKVAPVIVTCERRGFACTLLLTGQHRDTVQDLVEEFGITSRQELALSAEERATIGSLVRWLPRAYIAVRRKLRAMADDAVGVDVVVHGDTLSTLVGAYAGRACGARIFHLESGLSSGRLFDPFPEELTRRLVFRTTDVAFCPGAGSADYMRHRHECEVVDTGGNTVIDAVALSGALDAKRDPARPHLVVSIHRFQNLFNPARLQHLATLVAQLAKRYPTHFVLHPATHKRLHVTGLLPGLQAIPGLHLLPRLGYRQFLALAATASCVLTDGGSNQEELAMLGVPTIVMRQRTERPDGLGRNAMMESDVPGGVLDYVLQVRHEDLRMPVQVPTGTWPSERIAAYFASADS